MSSILKRLLGIVYAEQNGQVVQLRGVSTSTISRDIMRGWGTARIEQNMFSAIGRNLIEFPAFFAPDVHYVLKAIKEGKKSYTRKPVLKKALHALEESTWLKNIAEDHPKILDRARLSLFKKTPLPHQEEFFNIYDDRVPRYNLKGYLLSSAAGSGKTMMDLMLAEMLHANYVIIVAPKNSIYRVWSKTLKEEYKKPQAHWIAADNQPYHGQRFLVAHFEALEQVLAIAHRLSGRVVVVLDESHNMNDVDSQRTQHFIKLCETTRSEHVIWASGTPIKALGYEAIPLLRTIDPLFTPDVEQRFKRIFGRNAQRALDILRNRMGMISFRVEKKDVVRNETSSQTVKVKIPNGKDYTLDAIRDEMREFVDNRLRYYAKNMRQYERIYDKALDVHEDTLTDSDQKRDFKTYRRFIKQIRKHYDPQALAAEARYCNRYELRRIIPSLPKEMRPAFKDARSVIKYVHLKVVGEALGSVLGKKRAQCHIDMVPYMHLEKYVDASLKKTLIFTSYVAVAKAIYDYFKDHGYKPVVVYGDTNSQLTQIIGEFEKDPEVNPAVATYQSLSTAVPLVMANTAIFVNQPFRDFEKQQAEARVDRLGQDAPVKFINILLDTGNEPNVSTRAQAILEWSKEQVAAIMGAEYNEDVSKALDTFYVGKESYGLEEYLSPQETRATIAFEAYFDELCTGSISVESFNQHVFDDYLTMEETDEEISV